MTLLLVCLLLQTKLERFCRNKKMSQSKNCFDMCLHSIFCNKAECHELFVLFLPCQYHNGKICLYVL